MAAFSMGLLQTSVAVVGCWAADSHPIPTDLLLLGAAVAALCIGFYLEQAWRILIFKRHQ